MNTRKTNRPARPLSLLLTATLLATTGGALANQQLASNLAKLSIEDLMDIEVVTVSRRPETLFDAAAPVYVITGEELRRSSARTLPEALRLVPGLEVALTGPRSAAITVRGFNETSADKLEVLVDGRSVYTPLTSAVFWQTLDVVLEDIERIEVVRGPGGTIWGANAVNGVINVVTRDSRHTEGDLVAVQAGTGVVGSGTIRLRRAVGERGAVRVYALARDFDNTLTRDGNEARNSMQFQQAGFRTDWALRADAAFRLSGDLFQMRSAATAIGRDERTDDTRSGGNLNLSWQRRLSSGADLSVNSFVDWYRIFLPQLFDEHRQTLDIDIRYRRPVGRVHELTVGTSYRISRDQVGGPPVVVFVEPARRTSRRPAAFVQDRISLLDGRLALTLGSKFEHNDFTGVEVQPSFRVGWQAAENLFVAMSAARAVRTPNRFDEDVAIFCSEGIAALPTVTCEPGQNFRLGNRRIESEKLTALELLGRYRFGNGHSLELTLFDNSYHDLISTESSPPPFGSFDNLLRASSQGGEFALNARLGAKLQLRSWLSLLDLSVDDRRSTESDARARIEGSSPEHQAGVVLRATAGAWEIDTAVRHVSELGYVDDNGERQSADAYQEMDLRIARRLPRGLSIGLVGRNLLDASHPEFPGSDTEIERSVGLELNWQPGRGD